MEGPKKKHSCLDREYWYHNACDDFEWREKISMYACPEFDESIYSPPIAELKNLSFSELIRVADKYELQPVGEEEREYLELNVYYRPRIYGIEKYLLELEEYIIKFDTCAKARQNYYEQCLDNDDGHVEDSGHRNARLTFNRYVSACRDLSYKMSRRRINLRDDYKLVKLELRERRKQQKLAAEKEKEEESETEEEDGNETETEDVSTQLSDHDYADDEPELIDLENVILTPMSQTETETIAAAGKKRRKPRKRRSRPRQVLTPEQQLLNEQAENVQKKYIEWEKERDSLIELSRQQEVDIPYLKLWTVLLKTYDAVKTGDYPEEQKTARLEGLMNTFRGLRPRLSDIAFLKISREQSHELVKILIDHGTVSNVDLWNPFFETFNIFENDSRIRTKNPFTRQPYISTNKSYTLIWGGMKYYMNEAMKRNNASFNLMVLSRIVTLFDRRKLELYFRELSEVGPAMVDYDQIMEHIQVWQDLGTMLKEMIVFRVQSISDYVGTFLKENGYNPFTCQVVRELIRDTLDYVNRQKPDDLVRLKVKNIPMKFKLNWKQNDNGHKAFDAMHRDFESKCEEILRSQPELENNP